MNRRLHRCNLLLHMRQKFVVTGMVRMRDCEVVEASHEPTHPWPLPGGELGKRARH